MIFIVFAIYYALVFFFPWEGFKILPSVSSIYLFEVIFVCVVSILFKLRMDLRIKRRDSSLIKKLFATLTLAAVSLFLIKNFQVETPFKHLTNYVLQLIILAPIIEELIYRHVLLGLMQKKNLEPKNLLFFNSLLFSFSHAIAFFSLPKLFYPFIFIQLLYTFLLGWITARARMDHGSILVPIALHFAFNLLFLLALT